jgi:hypothetical protein
MNKKHQKLLEELMELNSHSKNYKLYREHLRASKPPMVPQIGIISRDLFGLEENNTDLIDNKFVNIEKTRLLEKVTFEMLTLQATRYAFQKSDEVVALLPFFLNLPLSCRAVNEKSLYERSLVLEKRAEQ